MTLDSKTEYGFISLSQWLEKRDHNSCNCCHLDDFVIPNDKIEMTRNVEMMITKVTINAKIISEH